MKKDKTIDNQNKMNMLLLDINEYLRNHKSITVDKYVELAEKRGLLKKSRKKHNSTLLEESLKLILTIGLPFLIGYMIAIGFNNVFLGMVVGAYFLLILTLLTKER